jgi:hypothetical protein
LARRIHVLPRAGGILDQDWWEMTMLEVGLDAIAKLEEKRMPKPKK